MIVRCCGALLLVFLLVTYSSATSSSRAGRRVHSGGRNHRAITVEAVTTPVTHAEGPHWDHERGLLYFVDISNGLVLRYNASGDTTSSVAVPPGDQPVSIAIPINGSSDGELVVTRGREVLTFNFLTASVGRNLGEVDTDKPGNRFNDGKADPRGRLWAGTMGPEEPGVGVTPRQGSLYLLGTGVNNLTSHVGEVDVSNGLAWSGDATHMYYVDTGTGRVDIFDYDIQTAAISNRRVGFDFGANNVSCTPDSMDIDSEGMLWVACWGGYQVVRVDPERGQLLAIVQLQVQYVTSVAFGGSDLSDLFVTTSRRDLSPEEILEQPDAGAVFKVTGLGVTGVPSRSVILE